MPFSSACFLHGSQPLTRPARALCAPRLPSFGQAACVDMRVWLEHRGWKAMDSPRDWLRRVLSAPPAPGGGSVAWRLWGAQDEEGAVWPYTDTGECPDGTAQPPRSRGRAGSRTVSSRKPHLGSLGPGCSWLTCHTGPEGGGSPADPGAWDLPQTRLGSHSGRRVGDETRAGPPGTLLASLTSAQEAKSWLLRRGLPWAGSGWGSGNQLRPQSCSFAEK